MSLPLPVYRDRPITLPDPENPGWVDLISVHDAEHLRAKAEWRQKLADAHPDRGGSTLGFHRVKKAHERWIDDETAWYQKRHLPLPSSSTRSRAIDTVDLFAPLMNRRRSSLRRRFDAFMDANPRATYREVAAALEMPLGLASTYLYRYRNQRPIADTCRGRLLALLSDGLPHTPAECRLAGGFSSQTALQVAFMRLRKVGFDVVSLRRANGLQYQLLKGAPDVD